MDVDFVSLLHGMRMLPAALMLHSFCNLCFSLRSRVCMEWLWVFVCMSPALPGLVLLCMFHLLLSSFSSRLRVPAEQSTGALIRIDPRVPLMGKVG